MSKPVKTVRFGCLKWGVAIEDASGKLFLAGANGVPALFDDLHEAREFKKALQPIAGRTVRLVCSFTAYDSEGDRIRAVKLARRAASAQA